MEKLSLNLENTHSAADMKALGPPGRRSSGTNSTPTRSATFAPPLSVPNVREEDWGLNRQQYRKTHIRCIDISLPSQQGWTFSLSPREFQEPEEHGFVSRGNVGLQDRPHG